MHSFKFEDYRQPWETGPHWELKREFIEKYSDTFPEDRLLCLAQAYSNIVLMNCRYPDPVMHQISLLSKPLEMRKRFQESNDSTADKTKGAPKGDQQRVAAKMKSIYEDSGRPFKQVKFCASTEQSCQQPHPVSNQSISKQPEHIFDSQMVKEESCSQIVNSSSDVRNNQTEQACSQIANSISDERSNQSQKTSNSLDSEIKENTLELSIEEKTMLSTLGLQFIQSFTQEIRNFESKYRSPIESISHAGQKLKVLEQISYDISQISFHPDPVEFCSKLTINNCLISKESGESKKKAKTKCAQSAVDQLIKLVTSGLKKNGSPDTKTIPNERTKSFSNDQIAGELTNANGSNVDDLKVLEMFRERIAFRINEVPILVSLKSIVESLNMKNQISYDIVPADPSSGDSLHACKFFIKNILISSGRHHESIHRAKILAVESGFAKLINLSNCRIENSELKECQSNAVSESSSTPVPNNRNQPAAEKSVNNVNENAPFELNTRLFNSSLRDGFVLVDNLSLKPDTLRNLRTMMSESLNFCRKPFEYRFEEIPGTNPPSKKAEMVIAEEVVGTGIAFSKEEAKILACHNAVDTLRKRYYTLKVKNEYLDGYIISRNQVFEGESFSSGALTENNIGCKMLKSMGWTGGGLGASGISEPVEAQGHHSFGSGLGYGKNVNDLRLFKKRIEAMLQDYSKTNTLSDLVFSKEFTKEERKEIHKMAGRFNLHTGSRGANENRFLTVRHKYNVTQILQYLRQNGGSSSKFELVDATETPSFSTLKI